MKTFSEFLSHKGFIFETPQEIALMKSQSNLKETYDEMIKILSRKNYEDCIELLDEIGIDPKLRFVLNLGFGGEFSDIDLKIAETSVKVRNLRPTQKEIGFDETLKFLCLGKNVPRYFKNPVTIKKPIVTFNEKYVIDGHHRWSELFAANPEAEIAAVNIVGSISPMAVLKAVQATIAGNLGKVVRNEVKGQNLLYASRTSIRNYLRKNMSEETLGNWKEFVDDPVETITENCILMQDCKPIRYAPTRDLMPQMSKDPNLWADLRNGISKID